MYITLYYNRLVKSIKIEKYYFYTNNSYNNLNAKMPPSLDTTFLTILRATMDEIDSITDLIQDDTYLRLVNNLQSLYNIHTTITTNTITNNINITHTITDDDDIIVVHDGITNNINITNFDTTLLVSEYMRKNMTPEQRQIHIASVNPMCPEEYRNNININNPIFRDYNRQIRQVVHLWETMSSEDQRTYITRPQNVLRHSSGQYNIFPFYRSSMRSYYSTYIINILNANDSVANDSAANDSVANDSAANDSAVNDSAANDSVANDSVVYDSAANITNFMRVLSVLDTTYNYWTPHERGSYDNSVNPLESEEFRNRINSRNRIFSEYNSLMREALGYWRAISPDEQRNIRNGRHINEPSRSMMTSVVWGGPIERIIGIRSHRDPVEIYDVL